MKVTKFDLYVKKNLFSIFLSIFTGLLVYLVIMNTIEFSLKDLDDDLQTIKDMSEMTLERIATIKDVHSDLKKKLSKDGHSANWLQTSCPSSAFLSSAKLKSGRSSRARCSR